MCVCVCVCACVCGRGGGHGELEHWTHNPKVGSSNPAVTTGDYLFFPSLFGVNYHLISQHTPAHPAVMGTWHLFAGVQIQLTALIIISALAQVGLRVPTPDAERSSQSSFELLAWLQEFASTGS